MTTVVETQVLFAVDKYQAIWDIAKEGANGLGQRHWEDLAIDKVIPWDLNHELYADMEKNGMLHVVTARHDGKVVGYHVGILGPHLHYRSAGVMCYEDMYYVDPDFRAGGVGAKLFLFVESSLRERGIVKWFLSCKVHQDHSDLFKALGFRNSDICFSKVLTK